MVKERLKWLHDSEMSDKKYIEGKEYIHKR